MNTSFGYNLITKNLNYAYSSSIDKTKVSISTLSNVDNSINELMKQYLGNKPSFFSTKKHEVQAMHKENQTVALESLVKINKSLSTHLQEINQCKEILFRNDSKKTEKNDAINKLLECKQNWKTSANQIANIHRLFEKTALEGIPELKELAKLKDLIESEINGFKEVPGLPENDFQLAKAEAKALKKGKILLSDDEVVKNEQINSLFIHADNLKKIIENPTSDEKTISKAKKIHKNISDYLRSISNYASNEQNKTIKKISGNVFKLKQVDPNERLD